MWRSVSPKEQRLDAFRTEGGAHGGRDAAQERAERGRFVVRHVGEVFEVAARFDNEETSQHDRARGVVDDPEAIIKDHSAWRHHRAREHIAGKA